MTRLLRSESKHASDQPKDDTKHKRPSKNLDDSGHRRASANLEDTKHKRSIRATILDDSGHRRSLQESSLHRRSLQETTIPLRREPSVASMSSSQEEESEDDVNAAFKVFSPSRQPKPLARLANGLKKSKGAKRRSTRQKPAPEPSPVVSKNRTLKGILKYGDAKRSAEMKKVQFGDLVITEFPIILGDNPAVTMGAPITIDWTPQGEISYKINVYESIRGTRRRRRKLLISVSNRAILLLAAGYSIDDIADASIDAQQVKFGRQESMQNQAWDRVNMMMESTGDAIGSIGNMMEGTGKKIRAIVKPLRHSESARTA